MVAIDQNTGEMLHSMGPDEVPPLYKVRLLTVLIHMGQIFGMPKKIIALVTSVGLMAMVVTGIWMWWQRRPKGRTGFPRRPVEGSMPRWGWLLIAACTVILPVAGVSILVILLIDYVGNRFTNAGTSTQTA
ncbi:PepSY domain-containing protein [Bremerella alba]|nr:PepSY domain-containing protein [Bremerella alba]